MASTMPSKRGLRNKLVRTLPSRYGADFVRILDGRCRLSREVCRRLQALTTDLGGESTLSHAQMSLCRRAVWLELCVEHEESRIAEGQGVDLGHHTQLVGGLLSIFKALGLKRAPRKVPSLSDYLQAVEAEKTTNSEAKNHGDGD